MHAGHTTPWPLAQHIDYELSDSDTRPCALHHFKTAISHLKNLKGAEGR